GPRCPALGPLLEAVQGADGHELQSEMARRWREGASLGGEPDAPNRGWYRRIHRAAGRGDVRGALRRARAGRSCLRELVRRRRGVPQWVLLHPWRWQDLLLPPRT